MSLHQLEESKRPLHILITGSSQGIGLAAARQLVQEGHIVYHVGRTTERSLEAVQAAGGGVALRGCNLADFDSIKKFAKEVQEKVPRLDVLCLNAGISPSASAIPGRLTAQGFEPGIGINHLGHFLLGRYLFSKLAVNGGGRLVITSSAVHDPEQKAGQSGGRTAGLGDMTGLGVDLRSNPDGPTMIDGSLEYHVGKVYKDSKLCNLLMARYAAKTLSPGITTVSVNPGFVPSTGLFRSFREESWLKSELMVFAASVLGFSIPVKVAGARLVYAATTPNLTNGSYWSAPAKCRGVGPEDGFQETDVSQEASNDDQALRLWQKSLQVVKAWL